MTRAVFVFPVLITACAAFGSHVPSNLQGNIPLTVANNAGWQMCNLRIYPRGTPVPAESWLGMGKLSSGEKVSFKIKPGDYELQTETCDHLQVAAVDRLAITSETYVSVGQIKGAPPPNAQLVIAGTSQPHANDAACRPDGDIVSQGSECCSGKTRLPRTSEDPGWHCCSPGPGCS
ncbi:MAG: hypothetical protein JWO36_2243 [Myxococcales bacterium]|nr:hypothetical protein [Myxococcales bacterium]